MCGAIAGSESEILLTQVLFMWLTPHATADTFSVMSRAEQLVRLNHRFPCPCIYIDRNLTTSPYQHASPSPNKHGPVTPAHPTQGHFSAVHQQNWQSLLWICRRVWLGSYLHTQCMSYICRINNMSLRWRRGSIALLSCIVHPCSILLLTYNGLLHS